MWIFSDKSQNSGQIGTVNYWMKIHERFSNLNLKLYFPNYNYIRKSKWISNYPVLILFNNSIKKINKKKALSISIITTIMSICKPQNINYYTYTANQISYLFMIPIENRYFARTRHALYRIDPQYKERHIYR